MKDLIPDRNNQLLILKTAMMDDHHADGYFCIAGDGMEPLYKDGDDVLIEFCKDIAVGEVGIFEHPDCGIVIRYKTAKGLHRINPAYANDIISEKGSKAIGRVLGKITPAMIPTQKEIRRYEQAYRKL